MTDILFPYGYKRPEGGGQQGMGTMLTWQQMLARKSVYNTNHEVLRRFKALIYKAAGEGIPLGVGTAWRIQPPLRPDGTPKPGFAAPGNSYHEGFPADGVSPGALAIDTVPTTSWNWMERNIGAYGFRSFRSSDEPWHIQPVEISASRHWATTSPVIPVFNLPGVPEVNIPAPTLRRGSTGAEVYKLIDQLMFWKWYPEQYMTDKNDGRFGAHTEIGVMQMQRVLKMAVIDGVYGPKTAAAYKTFYEQVLFSAN